MNLVLRLSVEDPPNSAGIAIDLIRRARLAMDRGLAGPIHDAASPPASSRRAGAATTKHFKGWSVSSEVPD